MRSNRTVQLIRAHHFVRVPAAKHGSHHAFHVVEILLGLERVIHAVVPGLVEFLVAELGIVPEMSAPGRFDQPMRHQRPSGDDGVHNAAIDQLGYHQSLLGHGHRAGERHDDEAVLVARHGLQHIGSFAELAAGERRLGHRPHQLVNGMNFAQVERFQRNQTIGHRIVQLAVDTRALLVIAIVMTTVLHATFLLQRTNLPNENDFGRRNNLLEVRGTRDGFNIVLPFTRTRNTLVS